MLLTNSLGEVKEFDTSKPCYMGGTSDIFEVDDATLLKVHALAFNGISLSTLSPSDFDLLKTIKHKNFINLIERYHRNPQTCEDVEAYTYEHIKGDTYNLLDLRTDFMINEFHDIQELYNLLTNEGIMVSDADAINSVVLKDRIVIIDPDFYCTFSGKKETLIRRNKQVLIEFMGSYFDERICDFEKIDELLNGLEEEKDPVKTLGIRLKGCKRPSDYFRDKK